jgi:hypothetical protein
MESKWHGKKMKTAKQTQKIQKQLRLLGLRRGYGSCWVCGSTSGVKAGRNAYATRCKICVEAGKENADTILHDQLKEKLAASLVRET